MAVNLISLNNVYVKVVKKYGRALVLVPFTSEHYKDSEWIHLCDFFELPTNVVCTYEKPVDVVSRMPCVVDCSNKDWPCHKVPVISLSTSVVTLFLVFLSAYNELQIFEIDKNNMTICHSKLHNVLFYNTSPQDPRIFLNPNFDLEGRSTEFPLISKGSHNMETDQCGLYVSEDVHEKNDWFRLKAKPKWLGMFSMVRKVLQTLSNSTLSSSKYSVLHWRRGDQLTERCKNGIDSSINCMDTKEVIKYINGMKLSNRSITSFLYIATNEGNVTMLEELEEHGIYSWWTLSKSFGFRIKNIEMFVVELQLMIDANRFLRARANFGWVSIASWIDQLVEIEREKIGKKSEVVDYP